MYCIFNVIFTVHVYSLSLSLPLQDDELGLGFAVSEADFNGQTGVRVSSISQRGPADLVRLIN